MTVAAINELINKIDADGSGLNGYRKIIQFDFTDLNEQFYVQFLGDKANLIETDEEPSCIVQVTSENFQKLTTGQLNPNTAFLFGKIKAKGDMSQLLKLSSILEYYK